MDDIKDTVSVMVAISSLRRKAMSMGRNGSDGTIGYLIDKITGLAFREGVAAGVIKATEAKESEQERKDVAS